MSVSNRASHFIVPLALTSILFLSIAGLALADKPEGKSSRSQLVVELRAGESIERINALYGTTALKRIPGTRIYLLAAPADRPTVQTSKALDGDSSVLFVEPNVEFKVDAQQFVLAFDGRYSLVGGISQPEAMYKEQWAVFKTRLPEAQAITSGSGATVAIVDTGVNLSHPALAGKFAAARYDFVDNDDDPADLPNGVDDDGDGTVDEATGHGTFLAGIVALVAPEASLMTLRVLNSDGWGTTYDIAAAIHYAVDHGADIINMSFGMNRGARVVERAVDYAYARNAVLVASAGNRTSEDRSGGVLYPARYANAVAVAATDSEDSLASFSNYGKDTDLSAPGVTIFSTFWNGGYAWWSGTSMSTAFASGGAALVRGLHPDWTGEGVASRLTSTAFSIDSLNYAQYRNKLGAGRIDFYAAVR